MCFLEWGWAVIGIDSRRIVGTPPRRSPSNGPAREPSPVATHVLPVAGATLGEALIFFFVTNFADWYLLNMYAKTWQGLLDCYVAAIPFFTRGTLLADVLGAVFFFGGDYLLEGQVAEQPEAKPPDAGFRRGRTANRLAHRQRD